MGWFGEKPYVPVAMRRLKTQQATEKLNRQGASLSPVTIQGRTIAKSFWGKSWCENLERYSDYANRLPRGRSYVRNGSVVDLKITRGEIIAKVSGSRMYTIHLKIAPVAGKHWAAICGDCAGSIGSLVELLQGKLSTSVMERVCRKGDGLFPAPHEIKLYCSCPDWADMCKHVAAVMYGVGARLDEKPGLIFTLRAVDENELIGNASKEASFAGAIATTERIMVDDDLSALFGIHVGDLDAGTKKQGRVKVDESPKRTMVKKAAIKQKRHKPQPTKPGKKKA